MSPINSGSDTGGALGMRAVCPRRFRPEYPDVTDSAPQRHAEVKALMMGCAQVLLNDLHPSNRSKQETELLKKVRDGRYEFATLSTLFDLSRRAGQPLCIPEALTGHQLRLVASDAPAFCDAQDEERASNHLLDDVQTLAEREKTPTRLRQVIEFATRQMEATRRLLNAAHVQLRHHA